MNDTMTLTLVPRRAAFQGHAAAGEVPWTSAASADTHLAGTRAFEAHRGYLVQCATWLLGNRLAAHAVVEETLRSAASAARMPVDPAAVRPWLFGLMKRDALDAARSEARTAPLRDDSDEDDGDGDPAFLPDGHWCNEPQAWGDSREAIAQPGFQATLERCIDRLPKNTARVFAMREILGMEPREICATVGISKGTCAAMLSRARIALHQRLQREWFAARTPQ
jgi:RNA polymerase sigma-70 factor (ECF subfamily)